MQYEKKHFLISWPRTAQELVQGNDATPQDAYPGNERAIQLLLDQVPLVQGNKAYELGDRNNQTTLDLTNSSSGSLTAGLHYDIQAVNKKQGIAKAKKDPRVSPETKRKLKKATKIAGIVILAILAALIGIPFLIWEHYH